LRNCREEHAASNAATGKLLWKFDSGINGTQPARRVAFWTDGKDRRMLAGVMNYLYARSTPENKLGLATPGDV
jgi:quinoprotein glucose dehydrogenase